MKSYAYRNVFLSTLALGLVCASQVASAKLTIDANYDSSLTADQIATLQDAVNFFQNTYTNNVTLVIDFSAMSTGLGQSVSYVGQVPYQTIYNALKANASSAIQKTSVMSLPNQANDPVLGKPDLEVTTGDLKALGLLGNGMTPFDGSISLNTSLCYTNSQGVQMGKYMLQAVAEHEMDEVLGGGGAGSTIGEAGANAGMLDIFRYSANGVRSYSTSTTVSSYLSPDGGKSVINYFNQTGGGADYGDWKSSATPHVQDAFGSPGVLVPYSSDETNMMQMVGWNLNAVPEPSSFAAFGVLGLGLAFRRKITLNRSK
jgi:hypothetical protein